MKVLLATQNEGKVLRLKHLLANSGVEVEVHTPKDLGIENIEVEENGTTLQENVEMKPLIEVLKKLLK